MDILSRMKEPSSWAAIAAALAAFGFSIPSSTWQAIVGVGTGGAALAGILLAEKGS